MAMLSFAFSIHNFISSVGADAGFAAIVGLAVLVLLYFAHARETANLREEAALLTQRLQQAEARVVQLTKSQAAPAVVAEPPAVAAFAPAFTAAPALGSATRAIAPGSPPEPAPAAVQAIAAPVPAMAMAGVAAAPAAPAPASPAAAAAPAPASPPAPSLPAPATNAGGNGTGHQPGAPVPVPPAPARPVSAAAASRPLAGRPLPPLPRRPPRRSRFGRGVVAATVALGVVAAAVVLFAVTSVGSTKHSPGASATNSASANTTGAAAFKPSSVTVAVLNGTAINQLAHRIAAKLAGLGYKNGTIATAANQTESTTVVAYLPGTRDRTDALHVATALGLRRSVVQPIDQSTRQVACPTSAACPANVVVTVGSNLAGQ